MLCNTSCALLWLCGIKFNVLMKINIEIFVFQVFNLPQKGSESCFNAPWGQIGFVNAKGKKKKETPAHPNT